MAESNMEKFEYGQFSGNPEEKTKKATGRRRLEQVEEAQKQLEKDFAESKGKSPEEIQKKIDEELAKISKKEEN